MAAGVSLRRCSRREPNGPIPCDRFPRLLRRTNRGARFPTDSNLPKPSRGLAVFHRPLPAHRRLRGSSRRSWRTSGWRCSSTVSTRYPDTSRRSRLSAVESLPLESSRQHASFTCRAEDYVPPLPLSFTSSCWTMRAFASSCRMPDRRHDRLLLPTLRIAACGNGAS